MKRISNWWYADIIDDKYGCAVIAKFKYSEKKIIIVIKPNRHIEQYSIDSINKLKLIFKLTTHENDSWYTKYFDNIVKEELKKK